MTINRQPYLLQAAGPHADPAVHNQWPQPGRQPHKRLNSARDWRAPGLTVTGHTTEIDTWTSKYN